MSKPKDFRRKTISNLCYALTLCLTFLAIWTTVFGLPNIGAGFVATAFLLLIVGVYHDDRFSWGE